MDKVLIFVLSTLIIILIVDAIRLRYKNHSLKISLGQAVVNQTVLANLIQEEINNKSELINEAKESSDAMINFLSTSREIAFEYISNSQETIKEFLNIVGPHADYYAKFGDIVTSPHHDSMKALVEALPKLKSLLPDDKETNMEER